MPRENSYRFCEEVSIENNDLTHIIVGKIQLRSKHIFLSRK